MSNRYLCPMKPTEAAQVEFIKNCLRNGMQRKDILAKFSEKWQNVAVRTFDTRLKVATAAMQAELEHINASTQIGVAAEIQSRKLKALTVAERVDILSKIALGEIPLKKPMVADGVIQEIDVVPDWDDRRAAIAELNKMSGDYAPTKTDITTNGKPLVITPGLKKDDDA